MNVASVVAAWCALAVSSVALGWQIVSWRRSGPRLSVTATNGITQNAINETPVEFRAVTVHNEGRASAVVHEFGFCAPSGHQLLMFAGNALNPVRLPATVDPSGGEVDVWFPVEDLRIKCAEVDCKISDLAPFARVGKQRVTGAWELGPAQID